MTKEVRILALGVAHDSSVCLINNGEIEFFCKEERLSRVKRDKDPLKSLALFKDLNFKKVDHALYVTPSNTEPQIEHMYALIFKKMFGVEMENYSSLLHHKCHASLAFYNSGFKECLVFVVDRNGSMFFMGNTRVAREAESVFTCTYPANIEPIYKSFTLETTQERNKEAIQKTIAQYYMGSGTSIRVNSFGVVKAYEAATTLIGQSALENGKTMGLSSYGADKKYEPLFFNGAPISSLFSEVVVEAQIDQVCFYGEQDRIVTEVTETNYQYYADKAKQVQLATQEEVLSLIKQYVEKTGIKNVCIVGGYGLNVVANYMYLKTLPNVNFYFEPVADDTGVSIGAAMLKYREITKDNTTISAKNNFYHYYDNSEQLGVGSKADIETLCELLVSQKSVAIFEGAPEAGLRALGHRSILYDPRNKDSKEKINKVKQREWYRPFAGVILESEFSKYFDTAGLIKSEYMTVSFDAFEKTKELVPGIIHVDGTCRVQTVSSGFLFDLLTQFYALTGCPMLLNTSFNLGGEPLIQTKKEALETLKKSYLDAIYIVDEGLLIKKEQL
jgi:carbamoyltransferase